MKSEPILWSIVLADVAYVVQDVATGSLGWHEAVGIGVTLVIGWIVRGEYTPYGNRG